MLKIAHENAADAQVQLLAVQDVVVVLRRNPIHAGTDGAKAEDGKGMRGHGSPSPLSIQFSDMGPAMRAAPIAAANGACGGT